MKKALFAGTLCSRLACSLTVPGAASTVEVNALIPHTAVLAPGITRDFTITQYADFPQDFSPFMVFLIGYGPFKMSLSKSEAVGDRLVITGVSISPAGVVPFCMFGKADVDLVVTVEIGNERCPYGMVLFSSWVSGTVIEPDNMYTVTLQF